jgi:glycosyltransferase involved in cell wall biosynthesis
MMAARLRRGKRTISVVTPCLNEVENVRLCRDAVSALFKPGAPLAGYEREHVFADNASTDGTEAALRKLAAEDRRVKLIMNARNFGALPSMFNAICAASGDAVVLCLPADLQDPPELIVEFVRKWEEGFDAVYGLRTQRMEGPLMRFMRWAHYKIVNALAEVEVPVGMGEFLLADRQVVDALASYKDYYPYVRGMVALCGFRTTSIEYTWVKRRFGKSKANWGILFDLSFNAIVYFSRLPLRLCLWVGMAVACLAFGYGAISMALVLLRLLQGQAMPTAGIPTLLVGGAFLFGLNFLFLGILGEYVGAIHGQVRRGPLVIERDRVNFSARAKAAERR